MTDSGMKATNSSDDHVAQVSDDSQRQRLTTSLSTMRRETSELRTNSGKRKSRSKTSPARGSPMIDDADALDDSADLVVLFAISQCNC